MPCEHDWKFIEQIRTTKRVPDEDYKKEKEEYTILMSSNGDKREDFARRLEKWKMHREVCPGYTGGFPFRRRCEECRYPAPPELEPEPMFEPEEFNFVSEFWYVFYCTKCLDRRKKTSNIK